MTSYHIEGSTSSWLGSKQAVLHPDGPARILVIEVLLNLHQETVHSLGGNKGDGTAAPARSCQPTAQGPTLPTTSPHTHTAIVCFETTSLVCTLFMCMFNASVYFPHKDVILGVSKLSRYLKKICFFSTKHAFCHFYIPNQTIIQSK